MLWGVDAGVQNKVVMLADGNGDFTRAIDLEMDGTGYGMGIRSKRFAMIVEDGVVTTLNLEEPGAFQVSSAEYVFKSALSIAVFSGFKGWPVAAPFILSEQYLYLQYSVTLERWSNG